MENHKGWMEGRKFVNHSKNIIVNERSVVVGYSTFFIKRTSNYRNPKMKTIEDFKNQIIHGDCLEVMKDIPDNSVDMILCDLPYGTTACKWDVIIPLKIYGLSILE